MYYFFCAVSLLSLQEGKFAVPEESRVYYGELISVQARLLGPLLAEIKISLRFQRRKNHRGLQKSVPPIRFPTSLRNDMPWEKGKSVFYHLTI